MVVLSTQQAAIIIYCKSISEITWVPYHHSQMPEYYGQLKTYSSYTNGDMTLATSNPEVVPKRPNYNIKVLQ